MVFVFVPIAVGELSLSRKYLPFFPHLAVAETDNAIANPNATLCLKRRRRTKLLLV